MKSLRALCKPRQSVFDRKRRDTVLDITDLVEEKINPKDFFDENYLTDGMRTLFREAFRRFSGTSDTGVMKLTQAMGGGKTHCMIALGLLAKYPEFRKKIISGDFKDSKLGPVQVVAFTGRESDAPFGIWGSIAEQLGKKEFFQDYYSPLKAPGQNAWIKLLKGKPLLILLDELPPYMENARSITVGDSNLSVVTVTALSNLLVAIAKEDLQNVCIVISDLKATFEEGSDNINDALKNYENEVGRFALPLEPVGLNTDEVYQILKTRLFEKLPDDKEIINVAENYAKAIHDAGQMDITNISPEKFIQQIKESYPFHPGIKDLFARFRENPGFHQTRDMIKLMRIVVSGMYIDGGVADSSHLIHPHMINLNDPETLAEVVKINPHLENAISHDIAADGKAAAEQLNDKNGNTDATDVSILLLVSSLANIPDAVIGLTTAEVTAYLCAPGRDVSHLSEVVENLESRYCWYLHRDRYGRLFFKKNQNLVAKLRSLAESFGRDSAIKELKIFLTATFTPERKDCYQEVQVLPAIDEIQIGQDKVKLILYEPYSGGLHPDLKKYWEDLDYKNRVLFLSGPKETMDTLIEGAKEFKAIQFIIEEMESEAVRPDDPQKTQALDQIDKIKLRMLSASRETFTMLTYPHHEKLLNADFQMNFTNNEYRGEQQIRETLRGKQKFTEDVSTDTFRKKCEERLFTQKTMQWSEIKKRAAMNSQWQWHHTQALDALKADMLSKDQWREEGTYINKGPFPKPVTEVQYQELRRNEDTGEVILRITPVHGDIVHFDVGSDATTASPRVTDLQSFKTSEMEIRFLCVDSTHEHKNGDQKIWKNRVTLKKKVYSDGKGKKVELQSAPDGATIRYTTDGTSPKTNGGIYNNPFTIQKPVRIVLAIAEKNGILSDQLKIDISWDKQSEFTIDLTKPARWNHEHSQTTTKDTFDFLTILKKNEGSLPGPVISVVGERWIEFTVDENVIMNTDQIERILETMRSIYNDGEVMIKAPSIRFPTGQRLVDFAKEEKKNVEMPEVDQQ